MLENYKEIKIQAAFSQTWLSTLGSEPILFIQTSLDEKEKWANKIYQNSRYAVFAIEADGTIFIHNRSYKMPKTFRKRKVKSLDDAERLINEYLA